MANVIDYFEAGMAIFPLFGVTENKCNCNKENCIVLFKHPKVKNWQTIEPYSEADFNKLYDDGSFESGFGARCKDLLVIDIDPRNGGNESYELLTKDLGFDLKELSKFVVYTGGGGYHIYFKCDNKNLRTTIKKYEGIDFKSSGYVVGSGSMHVSGHLYETLKGSPYLIDYAPESLIQILKKQPLEISSPSKKVDIKDIAEVLSYVNPDDYYTWIDCGMALKFEYGDDAFYLWDQWSQRSSKYNQSIMIHKWDSFRNEAANPMRLGSIYYFAQQNGYVIPVEFSDFEMQVPVLENANLDLIDIDTTKAPGLVGECIDYINSCSRFDRKQLAVSAALATVSSLGGLNVDDIDYDTKSNCIFFNVAGSATGKEAIQQAQRELLTKAGATGCTYGLIKSEQEMYRSLIDNKLMVYVIDEFGYLLKKVMNPSKSTAGYMEGIAAAIMSIYSKSDGVVGLTRDKIEEIKHDLMSKIANIKDDDQLKKEKTEIFNELLTSITIDGGLTEQFLVICGYTTPSTFNSLLNFEQATNGFIGRSLIFEEKDNHPRAKRRFKKPKYIPRSLVMKLQGLFTNGEANCLNLNQIRINGSKNKTKIHTTDEAKNLLDQIEDYFYDWGSVEVEESGLQAITRRAFEQVLKVSLILAIGDGFERKKEHVEWAFSLVKRDTENKITLVKGNQGEELSDKTSELVNKILYSLDKKHPKTARELFRNMPKLGLDNIKNALEYLVKEGKAKEYEENKVTRGRRSIKYLKV